MVSDEWRRIDAWLAAHAPGTARNLAGPATHAAIAQAETAVGRAFPDALRDSFAVHDGEGGRGTAVFGIWGVLSVRELVERWHELGAGSFLPGWWHRDWLPVAGNAQGDCLCVDLSGEVIEFLHDGPRRAVVAPSWTAWLARMADRLEAGDFETVGPSDRLRRR